MIRSIYSLMFYLILPGVYLRLIWRSLKEPRYRRDLPQRMGHVEAGDSGAVWVHAVSAGETIAAKGLVEGLLEAGHRVLLSNMTPTGRDRAEALFGERILNVYAPYDVPHAVQRILQSVQPKALIFIDTELWPNMIALARKNQIPVYLVNGRLSARSAEGYSRISALAKPMFKSLSKVFAQSDRQAARFKALGAPEVVVTGSVKFDSTLPVDFQNRTEGLKRQIGQRRVLLGASTHEGEESLLLEAFASMSDESTLLILAPRHSHRSSSVAEQLGKLGINYQLHSKGIQLDDRTKVYLLDTMGELIYFYGICDVAFVGGSLVDAGGHNPMEPGALGKPILMGPYRRNISDIADQFVDAGALRTVTSTEDIRSAFAGLLGNPADWTRMSAAALEVMKQNRGALEKVMKSILSNLNSDKIS